MSLVDFVELSKASGVRSLARSPGYVLSWWSCSMMAASSTGAVRRAWALPLSAQKPCMVLYCSNDLRTTRTG